MEGQEMLTPSCPVSEPSVCELTPVMVGIRVHLFSYQGRTDNSWDPWAIGDHGAPVSLPKLKKAYEKGTRGISWGP
ncbi:unnamed protein product, partial [Staurois parvus]